MLMIYFITDNWIAIMAENHDTLQTYQFLVVIDRQTYLYETAKQLT